MAVPLLAVAQLGLGAYQSYKANKMKANRPTQQVTQEAKDIEATYGQLAQGGVPGANQEINNIQKNTQNTIQQAGRYTSSSTNMLQMIGQAGGNESSAMRDAESRRQQTQLGLIDQYMRAKSNLAGEKQMAFDYNQKAKYEEDAQAKSAMAESGIQNMYGGLKTGTALNDAESTDGNTKSGPKKPKRVKPLNSDSKNTQDSEVDLNTPNSDTWNNKYSWMSN